MPHRCQGRETLRNPAGPPQEQPACEGPGPGREADAGQVPVQSGCLWVLPGGDWRAGATQMPLQGKQERCEVCSSSMGWNHSRLKSFKTLSNNKFREMIFLCGELAGSP